MYSDLWSIMRRELLFPRISTVFAVRLEAAENHKSLVIDVSSCLFNGAEVPQRQ